MGYPTESGPITGAFQSEIFSFHSRFKRGTVMSIDHMKKVSAEKTMQILDARGAARFNGTVADPRAALGVQPGHMPNSINIPFTSLLRDDKPPHRLKEVFELRKVFED